ncbi:glycoside hydrolase superfamily [Hyaloraphidium curvatum]|nr:glycoside hydrolase superfamily [Hyaloraphidium curvatum]
MSSASDSAAAEPQEHAAPVFDQRLPLNGILFQFFHWFKDVPIDTSLWWELECQAEFLSKIGVTAIWIPPAQKSAGGTWDNGYMPYDYYDLGEFPQKGTTRTKWGMKWELHNAVKSCHYHNLQVYADAVMNHMDGGDETEWVEVLEFDEHDRSRQIGEGWFNIWTKFNYWGRKGKHADFWVNHDWFDWVGSVVDGSGHYRRGCFRIKHKPGNHNVSHEAGYSYDFLTGLDLDVCNPNVANRLKWWGEWMVKEVKVDGFRLDAAKHVDWGFMRDWVAHVRHNTSRNLFSVAEYYSGQLWDLEQYLHNMNFSVSLFDMPLHYNLVAASSGPFDLRRILNGTLMQRYPDFAVTFVDNHDTQPLRSALGERGEGDFVQDWFRPHAYALILLRTSGYPCVFYPDVYGAEYWNKVCDSWSDWRHNIKLNQVPHIQWLMRLRRTHAHGKQHDFILFDDPFSRPPVPNKDPCTIGWTREGLDWYDGPTGLAVVLSKDGGGTRWMYVGKRHAGRNFKHYVDNTPVRINDEGWGCFSVWPGQLGVWIPE